MFKQKVENKGGKDVFIGMMNGRPIRREELEDPEHPGRMKASLFPCVPDHWSAAAHYRLRTPSGKQTWPVESQPDPTVVRREEAPGELLAAVESAQAKLAAAVAENEAERDRLAEDQRRKHGTRTVIIDRDVSEVHETRLTSPRKELAAAEAAVKNWVDDETLRRSRSTPEAKAHAARCAAAAAGDPRDRTVQTIGRVS